MTNLEALGQNAVSAKYKMQILSTELKNKSLTYIAQCLRDHCDKILCENQKDINQAVANGMHQGLVDRLKLNKERVYAMAEGLEQIVSLPDPIGEVLSTNTRPNGLVVNRFVFR